MLLLNPANQKIPLRPNRLDEALATRLLDIRRRECRWLCEQNLLRSELKEGRWKILPERRTLLPIFGEVQGTEGNVLTYYFDRDLHGCWVCKATGMPRRTYFEWLLRHFDGRALAGVAGSRNYKQVRVQRQGTQYTVVPLQVVVTFDSSQTSTNMLAISPSRISDGAAGGGVS